MSNEVCVAKSECTDNGHLRTVNVAALIGRQHLKTRTGCSKCFKYCMETADCLSYFSYSLFTVSGVSIRDFSGRGSCAHQAQGSPRVVPIDVPPAPVHVGKCQTPPEVLELGLQSLSLFSHLLPLTHQLLTNGTIHIIDIKRRTESVHRHSIPCRREHFMQTDSRKQTKTRKVQFCKIASVVVLTR